MIILVEFVNFIQAITVLKTSIKHLEEELKLNS